MQDPNMSYAYPNDDYYPTDGVNPEEIMQQAVEEENGYYYKPQAAESVQNHIGVLMIYGAVLALVFLFVASFVGSNVPAMSRPVNYQGRTCGYHPDLKVLPYLYYPLDVKNGAAMELMTNRGMCVQSCPNAADVSAKNFITITDASGISVGDSMAFVSVLNPVRSPVYATETVNQAYCIPKDPALLDQFKSILAKQPGASWLRGVAMGLMKFQPLCFVLGVVSVLIGFGAAEGTLHSRRITSVCVSLSVVLAFASFVLGLYRHQWSISLSMLLFVFAIVTVHAMFVRRELEDLNTLMTQLYYPFQLMKPDQIGMKLVALTGITLYTSAITYVLLQSRVTAVSAPFNISLDPNGGIDIIGLERILVSDASLLSSVSLSIAGSVILLGLQGVYRATIASINETYYEALQGSNKQVVRSCFEDSCGRLGSCLLLHILYTCTIPMQIVNYVLRLPSLEHLINTMGALGVNTFICNDCSTLQESMKSVAANTPIATVTYFLSIIPLFAGSVLLFTFILCFTLAYSVISMYTNPVETTRDMYTACHGSTAFAMAIICCYVASIPLSGVTSAHEAMISAWHIKKNQLIHEGANGSGRPVADCGTVVNQFMLEWHNKGMGQSYSSPSSQYIRPL